MCALIFAGCDDEEGEVVAALRFTFASPGKPLGSAIGTEARLFVAGVTPNASFVLSLDADSGLEVDPPLDVLLTNRPPQPLAQNTVGVLTPAGRAALYNLPDATPFLVPADGTAFGPSTDLIAFDGALAVGTASGRLVAVATDGAVRFDIPLGDAAVGRLRVRGAQLYCGTASGRVVAVDPQGNLTLDGQVSPPPLLSIGVFDGGRVAAVVSGGIEIVNGARVEASAATGVIGVGPIGVAWTNEGNLVGFDSQGNVRFRVTLAAGLSTEPLALPGDLFAVVREDGLGQTLDIEGNIVAEIQLDPPVAPLSGGRGTNGYVSTESSVFGVDFARAP